MPLFKRRAGADWLQGSAVIRESERLDGGSDLSGSEPWPWEIALNVVGTRHYRFALDVTVPGQAALEVETGRMDPADAEAARRAVDA